MPSAFFTVNYLFMVVLYGRTARLTALFRGFRPEQIMDIEFPEGFQKMLDLVCRSPKSTLHNILLGFLADCGGGAASASKIPTGSCGWRRSTRMVRPFPKTCSSRARAARAPAGLTEAADAQTGATG